MPQGLSEAQVRERRRVEKVSEVPYLLLESISIAKRRNMTMGVYKTHKTLRLSDFALHLLAIAFPDVYTHCNCAYSRFGPASAIYFNLRMCAILTIGFKCVYLVFHQPGKFKNACYFVGGNRLGRFEGFLYSPCV